MRRRGAVSRKSGKKAQPRKPTGPKRSNAPKDARRHGSSAADLQKQLDQRTRERDEVQEQLTTTAEILDVIRASLNNTQPVFDAIVQSGVRLFPGAAVSIALVENGMVKAAAVAERDPVRAELWRQRFPFPLTREYMHSVAILNRKMLDVPDVENASAEMEVGRRNFLESGYRAATFVPLMRGETAIGALSVVRVTPGTLTPKQLEALRTYAAQAVIAIENTRLLNELRESLQQQTATADVLRVISSSPGGLEPVFNAMLANTVRLCEAKFGNLFLLDGDAFRIVAMHNAPPAYAEERRRVPLSRPDPTSFFGRAVRTKRPVQIADLREEPDGSDSGAISTGAKLAKLAGALTTLAVPMVKEQERSHKDQPL